MKVKTRKPQDYEDYAISMGVNPEDIDGYSVQYAFPRDYKTRIKFSERVNAQDEFDDDLYDEDIALETRKKNKAIFDKKLSLSEIDDLDDESYIAYHIFLADYRQDQINDRLPNSPTT